MLVLASDTEPTDLRVAGIFLCPKMEYMINIKHDDVEEIQGEHSASSFLPTAL